MQYIDLEQLALITLRALKLFDSKSFDLLKEYCIRVINAWVIKTSPSVTGEKYMLHSNDISYLLNICHIYLMTVYESDHLNGFIIDNLVRENILKQLFLNNLCMFFVLLRSMIYAFI